MSSHTSTVPESLLTCHRVYLQTKGACGDSVAWSIPQQLLLTSVADHQATVWANPRWSQVYSHWWTRREPMTKSRNSLLMRRPLVSVPKKHTTSWYFSGSLAAAFLQPSDEGTYNLLLIYTCYTWHVSTRGGEMGTNLKHRLKGQREWNTFWRWFLMSVLYAEPTPVRFQKRCFANWKLIENKRWWHDLSNLPRSRPNNCYYVALSAVTRCSFTSHHREPSASHLITQSLQLLTGASRAWTVRSTGEWPCLLFKVTLLKAISVLSMERIVTPSDATGINCAESRHKGLLNSSNACELLTTCSFCLFFLFSLEIIDC